MLFSPELESTAAEQAMRSWEPGAITERTNENGTRFWVHRYSDGVVGRMKTTRYLRRREVIARVLTFAAGLKQPTRLLADQESGARSFATADRKTYSTLASVAQTTPVRAGALF